MVDSSDSFQFVSVAEAARILQISDSTVRRLLKAGQLEARQVERPQGHVWLIKVPAPATDPPEQPSWQTGAAGAEQPSPATAPAEATGTVIQMTIATVLGPLVGQIDVLRQTVERQAETIASQAGTIGRLESRERSREGLPRPPSAAWRPVVAVGGLGERSAWPCCCWVGRGEGAAYRG